MEVRAVAKYLKVQPRKVRIIADQVRGEKVILTAAKLQFHRSKSAQALRKVLLSAVANALENHSIPAEQLKISTIMVDEGPRQKRMHARAMGRGNRILKKTSHITVGVEQIEGEVQQKPHGTKAKPRPTFAKPAKKAGKAAAKAEAEVVEAPVVEEIETPAVTEPEATSSAPEVTEETVPTETEAAKEGN